MNLHKPKRINIYFRKLFFGSLMNKQICLVIRFHVKTFPTANLWFQKNDNFWLRLNMVFKKSKKFLVTILGKEIVQRLFKIRFQRCTKSHKSWFQMLFLVPLSSHSKKCIFWTIKAPQLKLLLFELIEVSNLMKLNFIFD